MAHLKLFFCAFFVLVCTCTSLYVQQNLSEKEYRRQFDDFVLKYNRNYKNQNEYELRFNNFRENLNRAAKLNAEDVGTALYGVTKFSDFSESEMKSYLGHHSTKTSKKINGVAPSVDPLPPKEFDWRKNNAVTKIKNQGECGSCWAFSVVSNVESVHAIATGELLSLSEQQLVDCDKDSEGCGGGDLQSGMQTVIDEGGLELENEYPYNGTDGKCHFDKNLAHAPIKAYVQFGTDLNPADENELKKYIASTAPLSIAINADRMLLYNNGVINPLSGCDPESRNHGVNIIGYGVEEDTEYWIIRNSWGEDWGEDGYFRIIFGKGACGLNRDVISAIALTA